MRGNALDRGRYPTNPKRIPELDGVRGIAILLVLIGHYPAGVIAVEPGSFNEVLKNVFAVNSLGVQLFFVLSGFLIGSILFRQRRSENYFSSFFARRFIRLMPLYLVVVGSYCVLNALSGGDQPAMINWLLNGSWQEAPSKIPIWSYFVYLQNFYMSDAGAWGGQWLAPTWSLAVEEQFYLLAPVLIWLLPSCRVPIVFGCLIVGAVIFRSYIPGVTNSIWPSYVLLPGRLDAFFIGILAAFYLRDPQVDGWLRRNQNALLRALIITMSGIVLMIGCGIKSGSPATIGFGQTFVAMASLTLILAALYLDKPWLKAILTNRCLTWIGLVSYGVYLVHMPIIGLVALATGREFDLVVVLLATAATFMIAALSWYSFEKPIMMYGRKFSYRPPLVAGAKVTQ
jgi:peptidoglycan/LPS O-acetylase OafA/YrhL